MKRSGIVTITTDFGLKDHYVGVMKGVILKLNPGAQIVDISNSISKFSVREACYLLASSYRYFPEGTVHLAVVDPGVGSERKPVIVETSDSLFVGPDNGIFSFLNNDEIVTAVEIEKRLMEKTSNTFHGRDIFAPSAALLSAGEIPENFGPELKKIKKNVFNEPLYSGSMIRGEVIQCDSFGNIVTDIEAARFRKHLNNRSFTALINGKKTSTFLDNYAQKNKGFFLIEGSSGMIEISVSLGNAMELLEIKNEDKIIISFEEINPHY